MIHSRDSMNECPREASGIIRWALQGLDLLLVRDYVVSTPFKSITVVISQNGWDSSPRYW